MATKQRMKATSIETGLLCLVAGIAVAVLYIRGIMEQTPINLFLLITLWVVGVGDIIANLLKQVEFTENGVTICRFGKKVRDIPWNQITQISVTRNARVTSGRSNTARILITPIGCEKFDPEKWSASQYCKKYKDDIISVVYTKNKVDFIQKYFSEISDFCH